MTREAAPALLKFHLGPVQATIEAARTLRDLWTGSFTISWLVAAAMDPILRIAEGGRATMITPNVEKNPLVEVHRHRLKRDTAAVIPCLPNHFVALVPADQADRLVKQCQQNCRDEWLKIADAVHEALADRFTSASPGWDRDWKNQVESYFEIRCVALPLADCDERLLARLAADAPADAWSRQRRVLEMLMDATRAVRHVPAYRATADAGERYPAKCSLLGSFEQVGPANLEASRAFWEQAATPAWRGVQGTRLHKSDRFCAISLVKRFAWPAYFAVRLGLEVKELRFSDTSTLAARDWLHGEPRIDPEKLRDEQGQWNGQWLHWLENDQGARQGDSPRPAELAERIQQKIARQGKPPTYYGLLHLDGDSMGAFFQGEKGDPAWGNGPDRAREISRRLTLFARTQARKIVEDEHQGELIYAGGDDVLALVPAAQVLACARDLRHAYRGDEHLGNTATISAGIAIVHIKEDLRFALQTVRTAEKQAKKEPGKDALVLAICRRCGEHTFAALPWGRNGNADLVGSLAALTKGFTQFSDRWTYQLRRELPSLPATAFHAELKRLLRQPECDWGEMAASIVQFFEDYREERVHRGTSAEGILRDFVTLCQSASFLARGRDAC